MGNGVRSVESPLWRYPSPQLPRAQQSPQLLQKFGGILELSIHRRESNIGDFIGLSQFIHDHLTDVFCADLAIRKTVDLRFDVLGHGLDLVRGDRTFVAGNPDAVEKLLAGKRLPSAVGLDNGERGLLHVFIGRKPPGTGETFPPPAYRPALPAGSGIDDLILQGSTVWTSHNGVDS